MPARRMSQSNEIKKLFHQKIREKVQREKDRIKGRVEEELPSWAAWAFKPLVGLFHDLQNLENNSRGESGETNAFLNLWLFLPKEWVLLNDIVLEPEQDEFAQIDHILVGPPGVYLIETKAWDGAFTGYRDNWKKKQGSGWVRCSSPTKQNKRHVELFVKWLTGANDDVLPPDPQEWVFPVVVFTRAKWLKVNECSMPVFDGATSLAWYIRRRTGERRLSAAQIDAIAEAVANAGPFVPGASELIESNGCVAGAASRPDTIPMMTGYIDCGEPFGGQRFNWLNYRGDFWDIAGARGHSGQLPSSKRH